MLKPTKLQSCDSLGTLNDCAFYVSYWNASKRTRPPVVPHDGPLLTWVFANHASDWIQWCTNPQNFTITPNDTHFIGFSSVGINQSSFRFVYDGVDRTDELYMCSEGPPIKGQTRASTKDPTGASMNLRVGVQGGANCSTHGALCDGYEGYVGGIRYYNRSLSLADLLEIYHEDRRSGGGTPTTRAPCPEANRRSGPVAGAGSGGLDHVGYEQHPLEAVVSRLRLGTPLGAGLQDKVRLHIYLHIIGNARIKNVGQYQPCMVSQLLFLCQQRPGDVLWL
eukprot:COSAG05_NODE_1568_length_4532_cov_6.020753_2_plen_279_part_00